MNFFWVFISIQGVKIAIRELREVVPVVKTSKKCTFLKNCFFSPKNPKKPESCENRYEHICVDMQIYIYICISTHICSYLFSQLSGFFGFLGEKKQFFKKVHFFDVFTTGTTSRSSRMAILTPWIDIKTQKKFKILDFEFFEFCL